MTSRRARPALFAFVALSASSALLAGCCAFVRYPETDGEAIVHSLEGEMTVACEHRLPAAVRDDLDRLREAVMSLPLEKRRGGFSPCGRMFLAFEEPRKQRIDDVKGVWIWPDWRAGS